MRDPRRVVKQLRGAMGHGKSGAGAVWGRGSGSAELPQRSWRRTSCRASSPAAGLEAALLA